MTSNAAFVILTLIVGVVIFDMVKRVIKINKAIVNKCIWNSVVSVGCILSILSFVLPAIDLLSKNYLYALLSMIVPLFYVISSGVLVNQLNKKDSE